MRIITQAQIALRIARRSLKRNILQSSLIIAIIAMPMALAGFALTFSASIHPTASEYVRNDLGLMQSRVQIFSAPNEHAYQLPDSPWLRATGDPATTATALPIEKIFPGVRFLTLQESTLPFKTKTGVGDIQVVVGESWHPKLLNHGPTTLISGRVPKTTDEVMLSPNALKRFGVRIGGQITTKDNLVLRVSGVLQSSRHLGKYEDIVYAPGGALPNLVVLPEGTYYYQLTGVAPSWQRVKEMNQKGAGVLSRSVLLTPPHASQVHSDDSGQSLGTLFGVLLLGPLVLLPVVVLAGSAFAFGARRQTRTLAVLSSLGASRTVLRNVTIASGVWLGLIGGLFGLGIGIISEWLLGPSLLELIQGIHSWTDYPGFHIPLGMLCLALLGAVALGVATSLVPAIRASKVNILATLRGTRSETLVKLRTGLGALVLLAVGLGAILASFLILVASGKQIDNFPLRQTMQQFGILLGLAGAIVTIIAFIVGTGWVLRAIRALMSRMGTTANFAGKDLLFNRKRYAPVVASVLTVTFVASFAAAFFYGPTKYNFDNYNYRYLKGQGAVEFQVKPLNYNPASPNAKPASSADFWAGVPKLETVNSARETVLRTRAFKSATVVKSTIDILREMGTASPSSGAIPPRFDAPTPVIAFNPSAVCYSSYLTKAAQAWMQRHAQNLTAGQNQPAGCVELYDPHRSLVVGGVSQLRAIIGARNAEAEATLRAGGAVVFNKAYISGTKAKLTWIKTSDYSWQGYDLGKATKTVSLDARLIPGIDSNSFAYNAIISEATASRYGIKAYPTSLLVRYEKPVPASVSDQLNGQGIYISYDNIDSVMNPENVAWIIVLLAGLFSLAATGIALGLSQIEARTDKRTLSAIGAPRAFRAKLVASQALALTLAGSILGAVTGITLGAGMLYGLEPIMAHFPLMQLAALVFGIPALAALGFWIFTPKSLRYEVRQALD